MNTRPFIYFAGHFPKSFTSAEVIIQVLLHVRDSPKDSVDRRSADDRTSQDNLLPLQYVGRRVRFGVPSQHVGLSDCGM